MLRDKFVGLGNVPEHDAANLVDTNHDDPCSRKHAVA